MIRGGGGTGAVPPSAARAARGVDLVASSSAMMRRMEARISSIDGSCDFAGLRHARIPALEHDPEHPAPGFDPRVEAGIRTDRAPPKSSCPTCPATDRDGSPATNRKSSDPLCKAQRKYVMTKVERKPQSVKTFAAMVTARGDS